MKIRPIYLILLFSCLFIVINIQGQREFDADNSKIRYMGRIDFSIPKEPTYIYPGVTITTKFNGSSVSAKIYDYGSGGVSSTNYYKVFIDGLIVTEQLKMLSGENTYLLADRLISGNHTVKIVKVTEGLSRKSSFRSFIIKGGDEELIRPANFPDKKIEFIGDSWITGYGNLGQYTTGDLSMEHGGDYLAKNSDNYYTWGPLTANALGTQYHITATSGKGLYRNNNGTTTSTIPKTYDNTLQDFSTPSYNHNEYHPDVIPIHLGTNDLSKEGSGP